MKVDSDLKHNMRLGLCSLPAILIIFLIGFATHQVKIASVIASGAVTLGFGASKTWEGSSFKLLFATVVGLGLSSWAGALAGNFLPLFVSGAMFYAAIYAVVTGIDGTAGWVFQQSAIAWMVSGYFPGDMQQAGTRAALVVLGGIFQLTIICLLLNKGHFRLQHLTRHTWWRSLSQTTSKYRQKIHLRWSILFAVLAMGIALVTVEVSGIKNGYWTGMTLLICLRSHFRESLLRVPARTAGTLTGGLVAGLLTHFIHYPGFTACAFILSGYLAFILSYRLPDGSYFIFTFFITLMVVFMISLTGLPTGIVAEDRLLATAIGSGFALVAILMTRLATTLQARLTGKTGYDPDTLF